MARLAVLAIDQVHSDPSVDRRDCRKRGDIVAVCEDTEDFGSGIGSPKWAIVSAPGAAAEYHKYTDQDFELMGYTFPPSMAKDPLVFMQMLTSRPRHMYRKNRYYWDFESQCIKDKRGDLYAS